jgi:hypothetical protein
MTSQTRLGGGVHHIIHSAFIDYKLKSIIGMHSAGAWVYSATFGEGRRTLKSWFIGSEAEDTMMKGIWP